METIKSHYPNYDVMALCDEWDSHTKEIVRKRLGPFSECKFFSLKEANDIAIIARHLTYDNREEIIRWIISYFDQRLASEIGEDQRKLGVPPEKILIREGLKALDNLSKLKHKKSFGDVSTSEQFTILADLQLGKAEQIPEWTKVPQKALFNKLVTIIISAYYSHPTVWSEIGYGGPAYPRGYVRVEFGLTDPWEARMDGK